VEIEANTLTYRVLFLRMSQQPYDKVRARAADFLLQHPVPSRRFSRPPTDCDTCRIIEHLIANNLTLTFQGDSVTGQVFWGLECDLLRRGYTVSTQMKRHPPVDVQEWRYGLSSTYTLQISFPNRTTTDELDNNLIRRQAATVL
jgi:hypothetical protein